MVNLPLISQFFDSQKDLAINALDLQTYMSYCRNLRNFCSVGIKAQTDVASDPRLIKCCLIISKKLYLQGNTDVHDKALQISIQLIGNLIVGNIKNKAYIWMEHFDFLRNCAFSQNSIIRNCTEMVIYNLVLDIEEVEVHIIKDIDLLEQFIIDAYTELEFACFLIEKLFVNNVALMYKTISPSCRLLLLKVIKNCLCENLLRLSSDFIGFINQVANKHLKNAINARKLSEEDTQELLTLLNIICDLSSKSYYHTLLNNDAEVIASFIDSLCVIHKLGIEGNNIFSPVLKLEKIENVDTVYPLHGIKSFLIRIIGNLSHKNKFVQDKVKEMNGITVILDCCKFDAKNPFIIECAIFAIANLCFNNPTNQEFIRSLRVSLPELNVAETEETIVGEGVLNVN